MSLAVALAAVAAVLVLVTGQGQGNRDMAAPDRDGAAPSVATPTVGSVDPRAVWPAGSLLVSHVTGALVTVIGPDGDITQLTGDPGPLAALAPEAGTGLGGTVQVVDQTTGQVRELGPGGWRGDETTIGADVLPGAVGFAGTSRAGLTGWLDPAGAAVFVGGAITTGPSVAVGGNPSQMLFAPTGVAAAGAAYILCRGNSDLEPGSVTVAGADGAITRLTVGVNPTDMAIAGADRPDAGTVYVAVTGDDTVAVLDGGSGPVRHLTGFHAPMRVEPAGTGAPDPRAVYLLDADGLQVIDGDGTARRSVGLPADATDMAVAPPGTPNAGTVYVTHADGTLSVIDPATLTVTARRVGRHPTAVAVFPADSPRAGQIATADLVDGTVSLLDPDGTPRLSVDVGALPVDVRAVATSA